MEVGKVSGNKTDLLQGEDKQKHQKTIKNQCIDIVLYIIFIIVASIGEYILYFTTIIMFSVVNIFKMADVSVKDIL